MYQQNVHASELHNWIICSNESNITDCLFLKRKGKGFDAFFNLPVWSSRWQEVTISALADGYDDKSVRFYFKYFQVVS